MGENESRGQRGKRTGTDETIARFARRERWVVTTEELLALGVSRDPADRR